LAATGPDSVGKLLRQYGCGPIEFAGTVNVLYERHLAFDNVVKPAAVDARERFEAFAHSVGDILSQRWARKAILNVAGSGKISSDRTIAEYAVGIWNAKPCPVS
jgi:glucan phosphorylase